MSVITTWTDEDVAKLRRLRAEELSIGEIAEAMGHPKQAVHAAAKVFDTKNRTTSRAREIVFNVLADAADRGDRCPPNFVICDATGQCRSSVAYHITCLAITGRIELRAKSNLRAVRIVATGAETQGFDNFYERNAVPTPREVVKLPDPVPLTRVGCPSCGTRLDADPSLCCARGRALRKLAA